MSLTKGHVTYLRNVLGLETTNDFNYKEIPNDPEDNKIAGVQDITDILNMLCIKNTNGKYTLGNQTLNPMDAFNAIIYHVVDGKSVDIVTEAAAEAAAKGDNTTAEAAAKQTTKNLLFESVAKQYFSSANSILNTPTLVSMRPYNKPLLDVIQSKYKCIMPPNLVKILRYCNNSTAMPTIMFYKNLYEFITKMQLSPGIINDILRDISNNKDMNNDLFIITIMNLQISFAEKIFLMQLIYLSDLSDSRKNNLIHAISNYDVYLFYVLAKYTDHTKDTSMISLFKIFMNGKAGINDLYFDNNSEMRTKTAILDILSSLSSDNKFSLYNTDTNKSNIAGLDDNTAQEYQTFLRGNELFDKYYNDLAIEFRVPVLLKTIRNNKELSEKLTSSYNKQDKTVLNILTQYGNNVSKLSTVAEKTILGGMNKRFTNKYQYGGDDMTEQERQLIRLRDGLNDDAKYDQDKFGTDILFNCILSNDSERFGKCANTFAMSTLKMEILKKIKGFSNETKMALCKALDIQFVNGHIETYDSWLNRFYKEKDGKYKEYNHDQYPWNYIGYKRSDIRGKSIKEIREDLDIAKIRARETVKFIVHMLIDSIMYVNGVSGTYRTDYQRYLNGYPHDETLTHSTWDDRLKTLHLRTKPQYTPPMPNPSLNRAQFNTILSYKPQSLFGGQTGGGQNSDMFRRYFNVLKNKLPSLGFHMDPKDEKIFTEALDKYEEAENNLILSFRRYFFAMNNYKKVQEGHIGKSGTVSEDELREIYNQIEAQSRLQVNGEAQLIAYLQKIQSILDTKLRPIKFTSYEQSHVDKIDQIV